MHLHTSSSPVAPARRAITLGIVAALVTFSACGGDDDAAESSGTAAGATAVTADAGTADAPEVPEATSTAPATTGAPAGDEPAAPTPPSDGAGTPADLCATIPSLDTMNAVLSEPVTAAENLPRTPGEAICDVTGDGASNVTFSVLSPADRAQVDETVGELGYTVTDVSDPELPGGYGYAGVAAVIVDGTQYSVQAIDLDVIMDAANPKWITRSAELLKLWLANLGVTP